MCVWGRLEEVGVDGGGGKGRGGADGTATHANTLETAILSKFDLLHLGGSASRRNCVIFFPIMKVV